MKKVFCFGEILIRMSPATQGKWIEEAAIASYLGGAELNVATALANWEIPVQYCSAAPDNTLTHEILGHFEKRNIDTQTFILSGNRIGLYYLPQGTDLKNSGVIYDRAHSSFSELTPETIDWDKQLKVAAWFHLSAISPAINENIAKICIEALEAASRLGIKISVDLNYRSKLWKYLESPIETMNKIVSYCDVVMGNIWSANTLLGIPLHTDIENNRSKETLLLQNNATANSIFNQFPKCKLVANTFRLDTEKGVQYFSVLNEKNEVYVSKEFLLPNVIDKAGSGDCFMAGLIFGNIHHLSPQETLDFATKAAVGKMLEKGDSSHQTLLTTYQMESIISRNSNDIYEFIQQQGMIPLFYHEEAEVSIEVVDALYQAGVRVVEYTNRGKKALENFKQLIATRNERWQGLKLGAGTIKSVIDAQQFIQAGADFIIAPGVVPAVATLVQASNLAWIPGCMTPSEIILAEQLGAKWVKIFPGNILGPAYIKGIKEIFPNLKFMPTGGVDVSEENISAWFNAGVSAVGMGSKLISEGILSKRDYKGIKQLTNTALEIVLKVRK
jgi:2-dehydro-3-deoxygluconokinase